MMPRRQYPASSNFDCDLDMPGSARSKQLSSGPTTSAAATTSSKVVRAGAAKRPRQRPNQGAIQDSYQMEPGYSIHDRNYDDYSPEETEEFESPGAARTRQFLPNPATKGPRIYLPKRPRVRRNVDNLSGASPDFNDHQNYGHYRREYDGASDDEWNYAYNNSSMKKAPAPKASRRGARSGGQGKRSASGQFRQQQSQSYMDYDAYDRGQQLGMSEMGPDDAGNYMETFGCSYCTKVFSSRAALSKHERRHLNEMQFACAFCPMIFVDLPSKNAHERAHEEQQQFPCSYCSLHFQTLIARRIHELQCAPEKAFTCAFCPISFITEAQKEKHEKTHDEEQNSLRSYSPPMLDTTSPPEPVRVRKPRKKKEPHVGPKPTYACIFCPETFTSEFMRARHLTTHPEMQTYPCNVCQMRFASIQSLTKHKTTHERMRRFPCPYCPKDYGTKDRLRIHEREHMKDMPFGCSMCSDRFMTEGEKAAHELNHSSQQEFKCSHCPKIFESEALKNTHESRHKKNVNDRTHQCTYCARKFHLLEHKIAHENFHPKLTCISAETVDPRIL